MRLWSGWIIVALCGAAWMGAGGSMGAEKEPIVFNDDGGWCWFEDERAIFHDGKLLIASIAGGGADPQRKGNIEVVTYDVKSGKKDLAVLHPRFPCDDHNSPALVALPGGRVLAMYAMHNPENRSYVRVSTAPGKWEERPPVVWSPTSRVTYSNLHELTAENGGKGRLYNFFRGLDNTFKPSWGYSDDLGETWHTGGLLIDFKEPEAPARRHRPYVKYASNGRDTVHFAFTEGHPNEYRRTGIYHAFLRDGMLCRSDGTPVRALKDGPITPAEATCIFAGDPEKIAWTSDLHLDARGRPFLAFSLHIGTESTDHRYYQARWDGARWNVHEVAFAGGYLYAAERDYTGNISLDPRDPDTLFISTNVDPAAGTPLPSGHWELFRGTTRDAGAHWQWSPLTPNATEDNIRPIVPLPENGRTALLWMRGKYHSYTSFETAIVGTMLP